MKYKFEFKKFNKGCIDFVCVNVVEREVRFVEFSSCVVRVRLVIREFWERSEGAVALRFEDRRRVEALSMFGRVFIICRFVLLVRSCSICCWIFFFGGLDFV